ncbi:MAG TPA: GtrA family protein [Actinospica sp.]|nr:GtrA family protein [Actinospica sp.]
MRGTGWLTRDRIAEMVRYCAVGLAVFALDEGCLILLHSQAHLPLSVATALAYAAASLVNFIGSRQWVFEQAAQGAAPRAALIRYFILVVIGLLFTAAAVPLISATGIDYRIAKVMASLLVGIGNYFALPMWVFKK